MIIENVLYAILQVRYTTVKERAFDMYVSLCFPLSLYMLYIYIYVLIEAIFDLAQIRYKTQHA